MILLKKLSFTKTTWFLICLGMVTTFAAILLSLWNWKLVDRKMRNDFLQQVAPIAQAIDIDVIYQLSGTSDDLNHAHYQQLKQQLIATRRIFPDMRFLYLMGQNEDGDLYFYIDSESAGSQDESLPGEIYEPATPALLNAFANAKLAIDGPATDDWGTWVSAIIPLTDPRSGNVIAVFGVDIDAQNWKNQIAREILFPTVLMGLLVIIVWGMIILRKRRKKTDDPRKHFLSRHDLVLYTGLLGGCVTVLFVWYGQFFERNSRHEIFERLVSAKAGRISTALYELDKSYMEGLGQLFASSEFISQQEFTEYSKALAKNSLTSTWAWVPLVTNQDRIAFEEAARHEGLSRYSLWEKNKAGNPIHAGKREVYYPISYIAPYNPEDPLLGFDLASEESFHSALLHSKQTGLTTATDPMLMAGAAGEKSIIVFKPVTTEKPGKQVGFVIASIQADRLMHLVTGNELSRELSLYVDFLQLNTNQHAFPLASTSPTNITQNHLQNDLHDHFDAEFTYIQPIFIFGKAYVVAAHPSEVFYQVYPPTTEKTIAVSGGILTVLFMLLVGVYTDRNFVLSKLVKQRTQELQESEQKFRISLKNSPVIVFQQDMNLRYSWIHNPHPAFTPFEIIGKTDAELLPAEDAARLTKIKQQVLDTGIGSRQIVENTIEAQPVYYDLSVDPVRNEKGEITGIICSSINITERILAEEKIRLHSAALNSSANAIIITDREGKIEWVNPAFSALTGFSFEESFGKNPRDLVKSNQHDPAFYKSMWNTILVGESWRSEIINRKKDGSLYTEEISITPVKSELGAITHFVAIKQDITERKQREREIIKQNKEIQILYEASQQIGQSLQINDIYTSFYKLVSNIMPCDCLFIASYSHSNEMITARYAAVDGKQIDIHQLPPIPLEPEGQGLVSPVIRSRTSRLINDIRSEMHPARAKYYVNEDGDVYEEQDISPEERKVQSIILIPQIFQNDIKGVVQIQSYTRNVFSENDLKMAEALVSQIAVATNNALLYQQTLDEITTRTQAEKRLSRLLKREESLISLSQKLADTLNIQDICNIAQDYLNEMIGLSCFGVSSVDETNKTIDTDYLTYKGIQIDVSQIDRVYYSKNTTNCIRAETVLSRTIIVAREGLSSDICLSKYLQHRKQEIQSAIIVPMLVEDRVTGLLELYRDENNDFTPVDSEWLTMVANLIGLSLQNARLYTQATNRSENLMALHSIDMAINSGFDLRLTINIFLEQVINQLKVDAACVLLHDKQTYQLQYYLGLGCSNPGKRFPGGSLAEKPFAEAISLERKNLHIQDLRQIENHPSALDLIKAGFTGYYGVPLIAKGQVKGVLELYQRSILAPDREWLDFVEILAGQSAIAIETAEIFENLQQSNMELTLAYDATIQGWSQALDLRDKETEGHTQRVTEMAVQFARKLGLRQSDILNIRRGALLHDIGKIGVPDSILHKPGSLTDQEWAIMRKHPETALSLLSNIEYLHDAIEIPYCHHEKWDGSGYPRGLHGKEIPLAARLFAIIDVWDALSSDRPYRPAWSCEQVLDYIQKYKGSHFDPELVPIFIQLVKEFSAE